MFEKLQSDILVVKFCGIARVCVSEKLAEFSLLQNEGIGVLPHV